MCLLRSRPHVAGIEGTFVFFVSCFSCSAKQPVIVGVATDPEPLNTFRDGHPECSITQPHANASDLSGAHVLEAQRRMRRILFEQDEVSTRQILYMLRQEIKTLLGACRI